MEQQKNQDSKDWGKDGSVKTENYGNQAQAAKSKLSDPNDIHPVVQNDDIVKSSGRDKGKVNPPLTSIAPSSGNPSTSEPKILEDVSELFGEDMDNEYPFDKLELAQAFFVPTQPNSTTDALLAKLHRSINAAKKHFGEVEVNEEGDEIWDMLCIRNKKRNPDGSIELNGDGTPNTGANFTQQPRYIYTRNYVAKAVIKGQKLGEGGSEAESDGVVVVRVA